MLAVFSARLDGAPFNTPKISGMGDGWALRDSDSLGNWVQLSLAELGARMSTEFEGPRQAPLRPCVELPEPWER